MALAEVLQGMTRELGDLMGIAVVGVDGIVVEEYTAGQNIDMQSLGAEYSALIKEIGRASGSLSLGKMKEISIATDKATILMGQINSEYFLIMLIKPEGNFGKGRFLLRRDLPRLEKEL